MSAVAAEIDAGLPTLLLSRKRAARALCMSLRHFQDHVQPHLRLVRSGRLCLVPVTELERWVAEHQDR